MAHSDSLRELGNGENWGRIGYRDEKDTVLDLQTIAMLKKKLNIQIQQKESQNKLNIEENRYLKDYSGKTKKENKLVSIGQYIRLHWHTFYNLI